MAEGEKGGSGSGSLLDELPLDALKSSAQDLLLALVERAVNAAGDQLEGATKRLTEYAEQGGPGLMAAVTGAKSLAKGESPVKAALGAGMTGVKEKAKKAFGGGGGSSGGGSSGGGSSGGGSAKVVNIIEQVDVGLPIRTVYDQWTQFKDFPSFTRKVESVEQESDEKVNWRAQIFLSHRSWESTILEQVPDSRIVWRSKGAKGYVDGTVTFHEITPDMTRILLVLEYHPQGFFEKTANLWRAQGRRVRSDFKHIKRHMMTRTILEPDKVEGWRGEIREGEVVRTHEDAVQEEEEAREREEKERAESDKRRSEDEEDRREHDEYGEDEDEGEEEDEEEYEEDDEAEYDEDEAYAEGYRGDEDRDAEERPAEDEPRRSRPARSRTQSRR